MPDYYIVAKGHSGGCEYVQADDPQAAADWWIQDVDPTAILRVLVFEEHLGKEFRIEPNPVAKPV